MNTDWIQQARVQGLIRPELSITPARPWPVVLLTGLAAWLAVPPLLFALYLLFGESWTHGPLDYVVGLLLAGLAVVLLRGRGRALFLEQLGLPLLLTGLISLGHALDRDLTEMQAEAIGLLMTGGLIVALPASWLRQLLGAAAAVLTTLLLWHVVKHDSPRLVWGLSHVVGLVALLLMGVQHRAGQDAREASLAALLEPVLAGWWVVVLGLLVWSAGPTFLVAAGLVDVWGYRAPVSGAAGTVDWAGLGMAGVSALLVLVGAWTLQRAWRPAQPWRLVPPVVVLAGLATQMPALGASLVLLALMLATRRWRLALLAAAAGLWVLGSFYHDWRLPLQEKALVLVAAGALMAAWARWMARPGAAVDDADQDHEEVALGVESAGIPLDGVPDVAAWDAAVGRAARAAAKGAPADGARWALTALLAFGVLSVVVVNLLIYQKEQLIREGRPVFVRLGPVDPRSLMQGDYMQLSYTLPGLGWLSVSGRPMWGARPMVAVRLDERGIVQSPRMLKPGEALPAGMVPLQLTPTRSGWTLVTDAWYFREGEGGRWAPARYGEFRLLPDGRALLVNLVGEDLKPL
ncbi:Uncharacterized membrane-anchored protein [Roseateles sp. YR242]|uniref:GDYXXLXY domain-containing protein n=1 Tax=Roseateles sp. YR242 TaxID=1855305 RepID=UPI0008BBCAE6|nr:GDYXXLXY domain-containing protein [Roseateles sp. YR242]SEL53215.1 Uncharacterized membrane-anchored protein [Roseateles sp. YR242]